MDIMNKALTPQSKMELLDMETWERAEHYLFFSSMSNSQYGFTVQQDITGLCNYREGINNGSTKIRFSSMLYYLATRAANKIPEFRTRRVEGKPVIFDVIHPAFTYIPKGRNLHANCLCTFDKNFKETAANIEIARHASDENPTLNPAGGDKQHFFYFSVVNGVGFTAASNPWGDTEDSAPRILFGNIVQNESGQKIMPVSVEARHEFMDGKHFGEFFSRFDTMCKDPGKYL
ncbi:CatA-like O-acetyltransferase [Maridesulfovibrio sp.]|uniref:CatA-like O-acetyltransferase n=1 Tax=Maridesulfovibrio sp. TaxID=2795000 RepID=UPI002AA63189|nr:CatA-like O-acetyltransferase [Maridesulfovibrio sp.]